MRAATDSAVTNKDATDKAALDGAALDGAALDGAAIDGAALDGAALDGIAIDGAALDGAATDAAAIGQRLRGAREAQGLTLEQLSAVAGLSKAHLSRLESGARQPSIGMLVDLAGALGSRISTLLGEDVQGSPLAMYRPGAPRHSTNGLEIASCAGYPDSQALEAMRVTVNPDRAPTPPVRHRGEEWLYVQHGAIELEYDGLLYHLAKDTSAHFDAGRPHRMTTRGSAAEVLLVTAEDKTTLSQLPH